LPYNNLSSDDKSKPCIVIGQSSKHLTRDDIVLTYNEKNQENVEQLVTSDDLVLEDKDSINSLKVDSGYTSRQVSDDNCIVSFLSGLIMLNLRQSNNRIFLF
jgi:fructose-bisphosphate aldolase class 1